MELVSVVAAFIFCIILTYSAFIAKFGAVFQQCGYRSGEYFCCFKRALKGEIATLVFCALCLFVFSLAILTIKKAWLAAAVNLAFCACVAVAYKRNLKIRVKAKFTARYSRITLVGFVLYAACCFAAGYIVYRSCKKLAAPFAAVAAASAFVPSFLPLGALVCYPYDAFAYRRSIEKTRKLLAEKKDMLIIAVTGSFGKTTVKNYLFELLSLKYVVEKTPESYNTPLGVAIATKNIKPQTEIFIVEMGARRKGDITELCSIARPDATVLTGVTAQHLETFGTLDAIVKEKAAAVEAVRRGGFAVIADETDAGRRIYSAARCEKWLVGDGNDCAVRVEDVEITENGSKFTLIYRGERSVITAPFYGRHNVTDFALAFATAMRLGVDKNAIIRKAASLRPPAHRFSVTKTAAGVTVIDDGYNANAEGVKYGAQCLKYFGGRKFVVFSGIAEGGAQAETLNREAGKILYENCDFLIAVGRFADYILTDVTGRKAEDLSAARQILETELKKGDVVAFFSDLPDRY